jgi:chaperone LolA
MITDKYRWPTVIVLSLCLLIGFARQAKSEPFAPLLTQNSLSGAFEQRIISSDGEELSTSTGTFAILRPHFFRWTVTAPGQVELVADGNFLWQHDLDLNTVSRRTIDPNANLPLQLLLSDDAALTEQFKISRDEASVTLTPQYDASLFASIKIEFSGAQPRKIYVADTAGQTIEIALSVADDQIVSATDFHFIPPDDVDLYIAD